ncbi:retrovirus-related pol polyprotein from transposon TNT 1-94 [Tanacetum coccineum]
MDLCGPMRIASVNGKKYILVIVDDYSRFTWVKCLRSKDEAPDFIIKFLKMIQKVGISHETSVVRSQQQNGVIERRNRTLIKVARTMLIYEKALLFLWAEVVATAYFDELTAMASEHNSSGPVLHEMTPATIITPTPSVDCPAPKFIAPIAEVLALELVVSTGSPSSTIVDQYAPSPSNSQTTPETQSPVIPNDVEEDNHDLDVAHMNNDPFFGIPNLENDSEASSLDVIPTVVHNATPNSEHTYKDALTQSCWIEAMQEELNEFERLEVWELVSCPDKVMVITFKWSYKVKLDELGEILKNNARGYHQEEGIDFEESFAPMARLDAI